jgi:hypothetical protein
MKQVNSHPEIGLPYRNSNREFWRQAGARVLLPDECRPHIYDCINKAESIDENSTAIVSG